MPASIFSFDAHVNMFTVLTRFLSLELQNKFSYNSQKGLTYALSPMVYLFRNTPFIVSLGGLIPLYDMDYWSVSASLSYSPPVKQKNKVQASYEPALIKDNPARHLTTYLIFEQDSTDVFPENLEYSTRNNAALEEILFFIHEFGPCIVHLEGHANRADFSKEYEDEQIAELLPLSLKRAEEVKKALIERGIDSDFITFESSGASKPVVDFLDDTNSWKNRRVEVTLTPIK